MERTVKLIQGEERSGFYVQPLMKRVWAVQLDILNVIDTICRRHDLKYYAWYGTLLGAVRHHGFIPWDDDMDLAMLREDYEKFKYFTETELPEGWSVLKADPTLIRILNTDVIRLDQEFLSRSHGCPFIIGVDIFCLDHIPPSKEDEEIWLNLFWAVCNLHTHWNNFIEYSELEKSRYEQLMEIENLTGYHFDRNSSISDQLYELADKIAAMYWDTDSEEIAVISSLRRNNAYRIPRQSFDMILEVPFEDQTIPVLDDYDFLLSLSYGKDYMIPRRYSLHSDIKEQMKDLQKYFNDQGKELPKCFHMIFEE